MDENSAGEQNILDDYYTVINNRVRREIVMYIGSKGPGRATSVIKELGISPGSFYDALKKLRGIVLKDENGFYVLTDRGRRIYEMIKSDEAKLHTISISLKLLRFMSSVKILFPLDIFRSYGNFPTSLKAAILIVFTLLSALMMSYAGVKPLLMLGWPSSPNINYIVDYYINFLVFCFMLILIYKMLNKRIKIMDILFTIPIVLAPQSVYAIMIYFIRNILGYTPLFIIYLGILLLAISTTYLASQSFSVLMIQVEISLLIALIMMTFSLATIIIYLMTFL